MLIVVRKSLYSVMAWLQHEARRPHKPRVGESRMPCSERNNKQTNVWKDTRPMRNQYTRSYGDPVIPEKMLNEWRNCSGIRIFVAAQHHLYPIQCTSTAKLKLAVHRIRLHEMAVVRDVIMNRSLEANEAPHIETGRRKSFCGAGQLIISGWSDVLFLYVALIWND